MFRAHVIQRRSGHQFISLAECLELDPRTLAIDQLSNAHHIYKVPFLDSTVRGSCAALTSLKWKTSLPVWTADMIPGTTIHWSRTWKWIWIPFRERRVNDFLWRLIRRSLSLGIARRRYSNETSCCVCPNTLEDYKHFLHSCPTSRASWRWFINVWRVTTGRQLGHELHNILFASTPTTRFLKNHKHKFIVLATAHGELLYSIWFVRCQSVFNDDPFSPAAVIALARFRIQRALLMINSHYKGSSTEYVALMDVFLTNLTDRAITA